MQSGLYFFASVALCVSALASHAPAHYEHKIRSPVMIRSQDAAAPESPVARFEAVEYKNTAKDFSWMQFNYECVPNTDTPLLPQCCRACQVKGFRDKGFASGSWTCGEKDKIPADCPDDAFDCANQCTVGKKTPKDATLASVVGNPPGDQDVTGVSVRPSGCAIYKIYAFDQTRPKACAAYCKSDPKDGTKCSKAFAVEERDQSLLPQLNCEMYCEPAPGTPVPVPKPAGVCAFKKNGFNIEVKSETSTCCQACDASSGKCTHTGSALNHPCGARDMKLYCDQQCAVPAGDPLDELFEAQYDEDMVYTGTPPDDF